MEKLAKFIYVGLIVALIYFVFPYFLPFVFAIVIAVLFEPFILFLINKTRMNRVASVVTVITGFFGIVTYLLYLMISRIITESIIIAKQVPTFINTLIEDNAKVREFYSDLPSESKSYIDDSVGAFTTKATSLLSDTAGGIFSVVSQFPSYFIAIIVFIVATYIISLELPNLKPSLLRYFEVGKPQKKVEIALDKLKMATVGFLRAQILLSTLTFIITLIGLYIIDVKYAISLSVVIILVDLLPIFGTGMVLVPWAIYTIAFGSTYQGVGLLILFLVITIFRRAAEPKLLSDTLGVNPLSIIISLYVGFELMGILGMIAGPTVLIVIKALEEARLIKIKLKI